MKEMTVEKMNEFLNEVIKSVNNGWETADWMMEQAKYNAMKGNMESAIDCFKKSHEQMIKVECYSMVAERLTNLMGFKYVVDEKEHYVYMEEENNGQK